MASAQSGLAVARAANPDEGLDQAPLAGTTSHEVASTGLTAQTSISNSLQTTRAVPGATQPQSAVNITQTQRATLAFGGSASTSSGAACAGQGCAATSAQASPGPAGGGPTRSVSGSATAQGLVSDTGVVTDATAAVSIAGRNYAPIDVVIAAVSRIANWGSARSTSGSATTNSAPSAASAAAVVTVGAAATSGAAKATGAKVDNQVNLSSSAAVRVTGNNYSPINIILNLSAQFLNWGVGEATSGNAATSGAATQTGASHTADSGAANATGLQVQNRVNLRADASVMIDGDNYAPVFIGITFDTTVDNRGWAQATTGAVQTGGAEPGSAAASTGQASAAGTSGPTTHASSARPTATPSARSGLATVSSDNLQVSATSLQSANANGATLIQASVSSNPSKAGGTMTATAVDPPASLAASPTPRPAAPADPPRSLPSSSGTVSAAGMQVSADDRNWQVSACAAPGAQCFAANIAVLDVSADPAVINEPPVPTVAPTAPGGGEGSGASGASGSRASSNRSRQAAASGGASTGGTLAAAGSTVLVNPWAGFPGRRLPPLPTQVARGVTGMVVSQDPWGGWPAAGPPPMPDLALPPAEQPAPSAASPSTAAAASEPRRAGSPAVPSSPTLVDVEPEVPPPLSFVDANPWAVWPESGPLPVPALARRAAPTPIPVLDLAPLLAETAQAPDRPSAETLAEPTPIAELLVSLAAALAALGAAAGARRGQRQLAHQWLRWQRRLGHALSRHRHS